MSSTSTETSPDSCPFCGAEIIIMEDGRKCRSQHGWATYQCFTNWHWKYHDPRSLQSSLCQTGERMALLLDRDLMARERDEAMEAHAKAINQIGDLGVENSSLRARVQRLEEAIESLLPYAEATDDESSEWGPGRWKSEKLKRIIDEARKAKEAKP